MTDSRIAVEPPAQSNHGVGDAALTPSELAQFRERGCFGPFSIYEPDDMRRRWKQLRRQLLDRSAAVYQDIDAISGATNIANYDRHLDVDWLAEHICRREIVAKVCSVLGPDVLCWRTEFFPKYPGDEGTDWHQADTFANASGQPQIVWPDNVKFGGTITVWTAFTAATVQNGCLQFMPGTHTSMNYDESKRMVYDPGRINAMEKDGVRRGFFGYDYRQLQKDENWKPDERMAVSMEMQPGQAVMFWSTLMHASHPHLGLTPEMRMGFAARYVPSYVRVYPDTDFVEEYGGKVSLERYGAVCVSGTTVDNGNRIATLSSRNGASRKGQSQA